MRRLDRSTWLDRSILLKRDDCGGSGRIASERGRAWGCVALAILVLLLGAPQSRAEDDARPVPGSREWVVGSGDSWFSMRSRICPVEELRAANPGIGERALQPGERILAPFVTAADFDRQKAKLDEALAATELAGSKATAELAKSAELAARVESLQAELSQVQEALDSASTAQSRVYAIRATLVILAIGLAAALIAAVVLLISAQHTRGLLERRLKQSEGQYTDLRRSIADLDVQLQRRMLKLLSWHETRVLTERQVEEATAPVVEMAKRLKERHAG